MQDFQTPPSVCRYMAALIPEWAKTVFEPTPGQGNLVQAVIDRGMHTVTAAEDFFLVDKRLWFDCIIMNPPFSSKSAILDNAPIEINARGMRAGYYILQECMKMSDNIIALMPWFTLTDSDVRLRTIKRFGLKSLTSLPRKTFGYSRIQTVVLEMERNYSGNTIFHALEFEKNGQNILPIV